MDPGARETAVGKVTSDRRSSVQLEASELVRDLEASELVGGDC